jgi:thioredoxin-like negative regulator of GroEL
MNDIHLAIIDIDNNTELVHVFEVKAVPIVLVVGKSLDVDQFVGLVNAGMIQISIKESIVK